MIASRSVTLLNVDLRGDNFAGLQSPLLNSHLVNDQTLCRRERIFYSCDRVSTNKLSHIAHLATTLSVEGCLIQDHFTFFTFTQRLNLVAFEKRRNGCVINSSGLVAPELRSTQASRYIGVDGICLRFCLGFFRRGRLLQFLQGPIQRLIKLHFLDWEATFFKPHAYQVSRRSKGVVKPGERLIFRHFPFSRGKEFVEFVQANRESRRESLFLQSNHLLDEIPLDLELGISIFHEFNHEVRDLIEKSIFEAKRVVSLVNRATHNFTKDVITAFVSRQDRVGNRECACPCVIGNDPHRETFLSVRLIVAVSQFCREVNNRTNQISVVV